VLTVANLPDSALASAAHFHSSHLDEATAILGDTQVTSLAIVLPQASYDHDDWRRALARDLARAFTPKRVNVVAADNGDARGKLLAYLEGAAGVTGQYLCAND